MTGNRPSPPPCLYGGWLAPRHRAGVGEIGAADADFGAVGEAGEPDAAAVVAQPGDMVAADDVRAVQADE